MTEQEKITAFVDSNKDALRKLADRVYEVKNCLNIKQSTDKNYAIEVRSRQIAIDVMEGWMHECFDIKEGSIMDNLPREEESIYKRITQE